jgi:phosphoglucosamine mutase
VGVRFGTDGIRGVANAELGAELVLAIGRATAAVLGNGPFLVGRDTRRSGSMLQAALSAGLASEGADVVDLGVLPTPGVAWHCARRALPGVVISASHNPFTDNGVKVFAPGGLKLPTGVETAVESELDRLLGTGATTAGAENSRRPTGDLVGRLSTDPEATRDYVDHLVTILEGRSLEGVRVVVDCANGAASAVAPAVLERLGASVHAIACDPDGSNINDGCGSTHPQRVGDEVRARRAAVGLALDGDADRLVAVDHTGTATTGDELLALFAVDLAGRGLLAGNAVVATVMSNLGFRQAMAGRGIAVHETPVGDRYVLEELGTSELSLGGEQSGHLVFRDLATTGDGVLTGVLLLDLLRRAGRPLAEMVGAVMRRLPQILVNVPADRPGEVAEDPEVRAAVEDTAVQLGDQGRVLLRASGTEPLVRLMVEAADEDVAEKATARLRAVVERAASASRTP